MTNTWMPKILNVQYANTVKTECLAREWLIRECLKYWMSSTRMPCKLIARECQLLMGIITSPNQTLEQTDLQLVTKHSRTRRSRTRHSVTQFQFQYIYFKRNRVHNYNKITIIMHNHISRTPGTNLWPWFWIQLPFQQNVYCVQTFKGFNRKVNWKFRIFPNISKIG